MTDQVLESIESERVRFAVDARRVVHEQIDGEVIIVQLEHGYYYSLEGSGAEIWELLVQSLSSEEVVETLAGRYEASPQTIGDAVGKIIEQLRGEHLIAPAPAGPTAADGRGHPRAYVDDARARFTQPKLERYTDMQDFLLVDPIHEVEDAGWPDVKQT